MRTIWLSGPEWLAVLRIGLGLWWLESWRHKDKKAWCERGTGIAWAAGMAAKHRWAFVRGGFAAVVGPRPGLACAERRHVVTLGIAPLGAGQGLTVIRSPWRLSEKPLRGGVAMVLISLTICDLSRSLDKAWGPLL